MEKISSYARIIVGNIGIACSIEFFVSPNGIATGGVAGVGLFFKSFIPDFPLSASTFIINALMLIVGFIFIGKKFALASLLSSVLYPAIMALIELIFGGNPPSPTDNQLLAAMFAGIIFGGSLGIVFREGVSTGGFDIPQIIVNKRTGISMSVLAYTSDFIILLLQLAGSRFQNKESVLYGIVLILASSLTLDKVMMLGERKVQVKIISSKYEEIKEYILHKLDRGVTVLYGETGYLKEPVHMLLTVMNKREAAQIKRAIKDIDRCAFIAFSYISEADGRGFTLDKHYRDTEIPDEKK